ncbi:Gfo/Idh/MocA family oxidoreductase [Microbacterium oleivorans]|uniref:Gfo/Idh/MocA family oxidoreductase n=1 Tax=Microbacterium oleivorans TaxID=273677 RepID=A0A7D5F010_9MICO|nr:Gfo/Idh/MocA family oxidoreductase [Microbacterium oleivorans]QLD12768.1 Gfo/Idh/MocA family oxidoreductase [Microbacterium oleivorans]
MSTPLNIAVIGAGFIGGVHADNIADHVPGARLALVADPVDGAAEKLAEKYDARFTTDVDAALADPEIDAVIIGTPARFHTSLAVKAAQNGKSVFIEKPAGLTLAEIEELAAGTASAPHVQIGFNRRFDPSFAAAAAVIAEGGIGTPHQLRSLTRDPGVSHPGRIGKDIIFLETLIHDFDALNWFNRGTEPVQVFAQAGALAYPDFADTGLLDTAVVQIRYANGSIATAEASFWAKYGYDIRGEVFGSDGLVEAGHPQALSTSTWNATGYHAPTERSNVDLFAEAYREELRVFVAGARGEQVDAPGVQDAERALAIALAAIDSAATNLPVTVTRGTL